MNKNIYLYLKNPDKDLMYYLNNIFNPLKSKMIGMDILLMNIADGTEYEDIIKSIEGDFYIDIPCFVEDVMLDTNLVSYSIDYIKNSPSGIYRISDVIEYLVLNNNKNGIDDFKTFFSLKLSKEIIDTGLGFIKYGNSITASKELYIHRNTLNYRIETIKRITSLDLKKFNDELAFYGLFHKQ